MEGKGFEPNIEALFGQNGFFPDTVSKALYWAEDKMPPKIREVLEKWLAPLKSERPKVFTLNSSYFVILFVHIAITKFCFLPRFLQT